MIKNAQKNNFTISEPWDLYVYLMKGPGGDNSGPNVHCCQHNGVQKWPILCLYLRIWETTRPVLSISSIVNTMSKIST